MNDEDRGNRWVLAAFGLMLFARLHGPQGILHFRRRCHPVDWRGALGCRWSVAAVAGLGAGAAFQRGLVAIQSGHTLVKSGV